MPRTTYVVPPTYLPLIGCFALFSIALGFVGWLHQQSHANYLLVAGFSLLFVMLFLWFKTVIAEVKEHNLDSDSVIDFSYRWSMGWFIFSEVMFFGVFFGTLFFIRVLTLPYLSGGVAEGIMTHFVLWPNFHDIWPMLSNPDPAVPAAKAAMGAWGIPAINTLILLTSGMTITVAHWGIVQNKMKQAALFQLLTILLGVVFLFLQAKEYHEAYHLMGLTLSSGAYGNTFFMLTGFHGFHVTLGTIMLIVILFRILKGHFTPENHFAFEAVAWYWHFVDVVWLGLFIFVYWL
jgi:cytochrome c oxidase subunit III